MGGTVGGSKGCSWKFLVSLKGVQLDAFGGPVISWTSKLKFSGILRFIAIGT